MINLPGLIFFDMSMTLCILTMAYLSARLGDALKIKPYYFLLYLAAGLIVSAAIIDISLAIFGLSLTPVVTLSIRMVAGIAAFGVCLRYWSWLFNDFFGT